MLIVFPLGLLATSVIFDIVRLATGNFYWAGISYWMILAGVIGGVVAAVFGLIDWLGIPSKTRAKRIGAVHGLGNVGVVGLFFISLLLRYYNTGGDWQYVLSFVAVAGALVTGWLGGELVDRLAVGVDDDANVNAPSSLSRHAAGTSGTATTIATPLTR